MRSATGRRASILAIRRIWVRDTAAARGPFVLYKAMPDRGQGSSRARSRDHGLGPGPGNAVGDAPDFSFHKSSQPPQFCFARRIMVQKFIGQTHRAQRQAHGVADVTLAGNRQLAASAAQIDHQRGSGD